MTTETIVYPDENAWHDAINNGRVNWRQIGNSKVRLDIIWTNDPLPPPPPKKQLTQRQFIDELAEQNGVEII